MKLADAHSLIHHKFSSRELVLDDTIDPGGKSAPYGDLVSRKKGHRQGVYSVFFATAASPVLILSLPLGLVALSLLGTLLTLIGVAAISRTIGLSLLGAFVCALVVAVDTPLLFYSSQFAEHTLATGLVTLGVFYVGTSVSVRSWHLYIAGALAALAATVRPECYCVLLMFSVVAALPFSRFREMLSASGKVLVGALPIVLSYWLVNWVASATLDPLVAHNAERSSSVANALTLLWGDAAATSSGWTIALAAMPVALGFVPPSSRLRLPLGVGLVAGASYFAWEMARGMEGRTLVGLLPVTPFLLLGLMIGPWGSTRHVWCFALGFTALVVSLDSSGTAGGLQHGARLLMPAVPALVILGVQWVENGWRGGGATHRVVTIVVAAALLLLTTVANIRGTAMVEAIAADSDATVEAVRKLGAGARAVVTDRAWESQILAPVLFDGKRIFHTRARLLLAALASRGDQALVVVGTGPPRIELVDGTAAVEEQRVRVGPLVIRRLCIARPRQSCAPKTPTGTP